MARSYWLASREGNVRVLRALLLANGEPLVHSPGYSLRCRRGQALQRRVCINYLGEQCPQGYPQGYALLIHVQEITGKTGGRVHYCMLAPQ